MDSRAARTAGGRPRPGDALSSLAAAIGCVLFLGGFVWVVVQYQPYTVPTQSMAPTVAAGGRVLAQRIDGDVVRRGDVIVFEEPLWGDLPMVKRVVGVGGDTVACCGKRGRLTVNGRPIEEPYAKSGGPASPAGFEAVVPEGMLFLLGDHRQDALDSRAHLTDSARGAVPRDAVRGRIDATAWPLDGLGMLGRPRAFAELPGGISEPGPLRPLLLATGVGAMLILGGAAYGPIARRAGRGRKG